MQHAEHLPTILGFLGEVGIAVRHETLTRPTFLPGVVIRDGALVVDCGKLEWPGDLLHEAGHLAVLPAALRHLANDDLQEDELQADHGGEQEALAWAYAAAVHVGVPLEVLIHDGGYKGLAASLRQMYPFGVYPGLRGLCESGMTQARGFPSQNVGPDQYPKMLKWLRD